jgi:uncharacterized membrane protein
VTDERALHRLEEQLGRLLITGVIVSAIALMAGLALYVVNPSSGLSSTLLTVGLFVLMATPMLRVVVSFVEYIRMKDWFFMATTVVVLGVLAMTVILAWWGSSAS